LGGDHSARIAALSGELYRVTARGYAPLAVGQELPFGETVRSAKGSDAVLRLEDGTEIELSARSEIELAQRRKGTTIELSRGQIIVEAAPQGSGRLFVATEDCLVSVKGTIFAVNRGTKGSRVSVMEGRVVVDYGSLESVLDPGEQVSTHPSLGPVPVVQEIAWSRNFDEYVDLMRQLGALSEAVDAALSRPELRYSTRLLELMPAETVFYAAAPNVSSNLEQAYQIVQERISGSPALEKWWQESVGSEEDERALEQAITEISRLGSFLGEEVTFSFSAAQAEGGREVAESLLLTAEVRDPVGLRAYVEERRASAGDEDLPLFLVDDPTQWQPPADSGERILLWIGDDIAALGLSIDTLRDLVRILEDGGSNPFLSLPFHRSLAEAYGDGVDWLVGADMGRILAGSEAADAEILERAGILDVETLVLERKKGAGAPVHYRAQLSFDGPRRGSAAWLEAPAPMASLDFVSPDANFVSAALTKDPRQVAEEL
ncbi:MAG: FecR domain-containing protein, partial [Acidobacteria bacterium]|nr:FecR domain-containing protein [Acidobacteriota bacterium]